MNNSIWVLLIVVSVLYVITLLTNKRKKEKLPYVANEFLLTKTEVAFYKVLKEIVKEYDLAIHSKVRMWDLVHVPKGTENKTSFENKIRAKHVDFVLTGGESSKIILLIELDDKTHNLKSRKASDEFKNEVFKVVGHKLLRVKVKGIYDVEEIKEVIDKMI